MIGFKNTDKWIEAADRLDEMSNEKLKAYRAKARADSIAKINTDRKKSISRSKGAQKAEHKILSRQSSKNAPANDNANHTKLKSVNENKEVSHYTVHKRSDHSKVGQAKSLNGARRVVDRRDNAHGSYEHYVKTVFKEDADHKVIVGKPGYVEKTVKSWEATKNWKRGEKKVWSDGSHSVKLHPVLKEDGEAVPANNVGSGNVAGAGVGANGEPGVSKKKTPKLLKNVLQRKLP